jgi:hypothetical protein
MSLQRCANRIDALRKQLQMGPRTWVFILLDDAEIAPEALVRIKPQDRLYIKHICLVHDRDGHER